MYKVDERPILSTAVMGCRPISIIPSLTIFDGFSLDNIALELGVDIGVLLSRFLFTTGGSLKF
ncbi:hypothetical protein COLO4_21883 [Corchorus olitorius]|uniref:Uncharacterized protein n=1 Tax=Corchorus olitorius TaxID=93759 RepID=A0A1R3IQ76_9ROSI|nr:hypothetical protein COLO4_21883 [Corchorus olitorius]